MATGDQRRRTKGSLGRGVKPQGDDNDFTRSERGEEEGLTRNVKGMKMRGNDTHHYSNFRTAH